MRCNVLVGLSLLLVLSCTGSNDSLWLKADVPLEGEPACVWRILDHWDNLDDTVERGYAGPSIWEWTSETLPVRRIDTYGALNEKLGINGVVLNNVNASPSVLDDPHLERVVRIADILRPHGIRVFLSVNFASPSVLGGLPTSDPLDPQVIAWWHMKADRIYSLVPDFGGFLVKASSEGQSGPQDYGRTHTDGANMLADALAPYGGIVMWRAFVYSPGDRDRAMAAYDEFLPLDGTFRDNVCIQVKNGPIDFQPREPFSPLFGAMERTPLAPELQITMEYLGQSSSLVFLAPMWEEFLHSDTYRDGAGSTVAAVTTSSSLPLIAGVANVGRDADWCGNLFNQANWYAFGRLAWDPSLSSETIAREWLRITFPKPPLMGEKKFSEGFIDPMVQLMLASHEACVDYMMPMGLHHLFAWEHHFGPEPWCDVPGARPDWMPSYYHQAGPGGIGFDRTVATGSGAVAQYREPLAAMFESPETCPEKYLLWFHHLGWDYRLPDGRILWDALCMHYDSGVRQVREFCRIWKGMRPYVSARRYKEVASLLDGNLQLACRWRDACLQYFATFSGMPYPEGIEAPVVPLDSLMAGR